MASKTEEPKTDAPMTAEQMTAERAYELEKREQSQRHDRERQAQRDATDLEHAKMGVEAAIAARQKERTEIRTIGLVVSLVVITVACLFLATDCSGDERRSCLNACHMARLTGPDYQTCVTPCTGDHSWRPWR